MNVQIPSIFRFLRKARARYKCSYGGRGAGKSRAYGDSLIDLADKMPLRVLCTREIQKSIKHSSKKLLDDSIKRQKLSHRYHSTKEGIINKATGSEFIFEGLWQNVNNIKSIEDVDICWIEEANTVSQHSLDVLIPSIRKEQSEIWFSFNPFLDTDPVYQMFVKNEPPPNSTVLNVNHEDNPFFPEVLRLEMEWCLETNPDKHNHIWRGNTLEHTEEQVYYQKWKVKKTEEPPEGTTLYHGIDWGFSTDPMAALRCWESGKDLIIDREAGGHKIKNDDIVHVVEEGIETFRSWPSYGDNSRPETISHVKDRGFLRLEPCDKWKGCVEDGVEFINNYENIIIDPSCKKTIEEFSLYKYKVDKLTGKILPIIVDKDNHYMDALRYALGDKIKHKSKMKISDEAIKCARANVTRRSGNKRRLY